MNNPCTNCLKLPCCISLLKEEYLKPGPLCIKKVVGTNIMIPVKIYNRCNDLGIYLSYSFRGTSRKMFFFSLVPEFVQVIQEVKKCNYPAKDV